MTTQNPKQPKNSLFLTFSLEDLVLWIAAVLPFFRVSGYEPDIQMHPDLFSLTGQREPGRDLAFRLEGKGSRG